MDIQTQIEAKLKAALEPERLRIDNDSKRHAGPATDSHYRIIVVSNAFEGVSRVQRQRLVYTCLCHVPRKTVRRLQVQGGTTPQRSVEY